MAAAPNFHPDVPPPMAVASAPPAFLSMAGGIKTPRSPASFWTAIAAHAVAIALIAWMVARHISVAAPAPPVVATLIAPVTPPPPPPMMPRAEKIGGGGGQHDLAPVSKGHLPKLSPEPQIVPPKAPPTIPPKLAVTPTVVVQKDLKLADNKMPDLGLPSSTLDGNSLGNGSGTGIGSGSGAGIGPGSGGNIGGGPMHIGGSVRAPVLTYSVDPEFSEEARKAKFSGNVEVYLWVDENGNPSHVKVVRGVGMGLDEKAVEAVRQYKFKPALQNGKPVKVDLYVDVNFQIF
ncbi:MAG TPA: energy transducer TonB [Acidobacteriaceae bacterium]|nr:energy transducer TonB [Acidobacteriaceae bacterium]